MSRIHWIPDMSKAQSEARLEIRRQLEMIHTRAHRMIDDFDHAIGGDETRSTDLVGLEMMVENAEALATWLRYADQSPFVADGRESEAVIAWLIKRDLVTA